jgi:glycosyltransferase A (GT-A) superfamily protein (DUF2064 family)
MNLTAYTLCAAIDGGYVLLTLPPGTPESVFDNVLWSHERTCVTQIEAIRLAGYLCI